MVGLDDYATGKSSPRPARPETWVIVERRARRRGSRAGRGRMVAADDAYEGDAVNVVALGDHLGADEQVDFARVQARKQALHVMAASDGVAVHAADAGGEGKMACKRSSPCCEPAPR